MNLISPFVENAYGVLSWTSPAKAWSYFKARMHRQQWPQENLKSFQWQALKKILTHCEREIPFYNRLWRSEGVRLDLIRSTEDLANLPIVSKAMLTEARLNGELGTGARERDGMLTTSSTTGTEPFRVQISFEDYQKKYANYLRQVYNAGWRLGMRSASQYCSGHGQFGTAWREPWQGLRDTAFYFAHRKKILKPYDLKYTGDERIIGGWYKDLRNHKPYMLDAFAICPLMLQDYIEEKGLEPIRIPVMFLLNSLSPEMRERISRWFGTEVFNRYSPHECEGIASACHEHRGMHMALDSYCIEFIDDADRVVEPGRPGRIVITDLENFTMPLIRYDIGDLAHALEGPCLCGNEFPLMSDLDGRMQDSMTGPGGCRILPSEIESILQREERIRYFQVIQEQEGLRVRVRVRERETSAEGFSRVLCDKIKALFGPDTEVLIQTDDRLEFELNGKYSFIKNLPLREGALL